MQTSNLPSSKSASSDPWEDFSQLFREGHQPLPQGWADVFGPLRKGTVDDLVIVGQIGQSLDGRIATESGHSKYINGPAGLVHLHRLRALVDAVVVGVGTAVADDPQLTVRRVAGPQPARVVIDPKGRLGAGARMFADNGVRRLLITAQGTCCAPPSGVEIVALPMVDGANRSAGDPRRARRLRHAPHADRRRRQHGVALSCRRLSRPPARDGRADHPRRRGLPA